MDLSAIKAFERAYYSYWYVPNNGYAGSDSAYHASHTRQHISISAEALGEQIRGLIDKWQKDSPSTLPDIVIIAHSLGGAVAAYWAADADTHILAAVKAVITLDSPVAGLTKNYVPKSTHIMVTSNRILEKRRRL